MSCSADCLILVGSSSLYLNHVNQSDSTTLKSCLVWCYTLLWMFSISVLLDASCVNGCQKLTSHWSLQIKFWPLTVCKIKFICACWTFNWGAFLGFRDLLTFQTQEHPGCLIMSNSEHASQENFDMFQHEGFHHSWVSTKSQMMYYIVYHGWKCSILTIFEMKWLTSTLSC